MSILEMKVPSPGESITEVEIATWLVKDGDYVEKDQAIAEVDSDKATLELPAEQAGIITLKAEEGEVVKVGQVVCLIDMSGAKPEGTAAPVAEAPKAEEAPKVEAPKPAAAPAATYATNSPSPAAKKILDEKGIDAAAVSGTGRDGRITKEDALNATPGVPAMGVSSGNRAQTTTKLSVLRRKLAARLVSVKNETAMLTTFNEVDMSEIFRIRKQYKEEFAAKHGVGLGFMSFFTKAVTRALQMYPDVNAMIDGDYKINNEFCDISIAVSGPKGLMVPVLRNAENLTLRGVEASIKELATKVRDGKITIEEMTGGTFTITNFGTFKSLFGTPIINQPQVAILGVGYIEKKPAVIETPEGDTIAIRHKMYLSLSYDHRVVDGMLGGNFLHFIADYLENWQG